MNKELNKEKDKDKDRENSKDTEEDKSENDVSEITDQAIFQGAISLLNKGIKNKAQHEHEHQHQSKSQSKQYQHNSNHNNKGIQYDQSKPKILQNLNKMDQPILGPSNSMYSSGILSFRNKKANFQNPQFPINANQKIEEIFDKEALTQSILEKMNTIKKSKKTSASSTSHYVYDQRDRDKDNSNSNNKGKLLNNESTKAYEEEYEEKDFKTFHTNSSDEHEQCCSDDKDNEEEESNRIFWQVKKDKEGESLSLLNHKDNNHLQMTSGRRKKHNYLNKIVCTLSLLENGKAIFVSQDDMIFVLPALFVPKNLNVGNTYVFKVREYEPYSYKSNLIQDIQKKYAS